MADIPQISENTKLTLDVKTIGLIISFTVGLATTYFTLKSEIALAMEMPKPEISSVEFKYKDELIRSNVEKVIEQVDNIEKDVEEIKAMIDKKEEMSEVEAQVKEELSETPAAEPISHNPEPQTKINLKYAQNRKRNSLDKVMQKLLNN